MKNLFSYLPKKLFIVLASILAVIGIGAAVQAGFGPDRPTYTMQNPADHITFNSITNNPVVGDERAFLTASAPGEEYKDPVTSLQDGDEFALRIFVHNDAAENLGLKATNTTVKVALPSGSKKNHVVTAYVSADNATPKEVSDTLDLSAANNGFFELEYVAGSASFKNNVFTNGVALSDSIVTTGTLIGYDKLDGIMPGCDKYSGWVTLKLKVKMPRYTIVKKARIAGEGTDAWRQNVNAKISDTIEWRIDISNAGSTTLENIIVSDLLPANMTAEKGSVKLIDSNFPPSSPYVYPDSAISTVNGKVQVNVDTGNYPAGSNAVVTFKSKIVKNEDTICGVQFKNEAYATPKGYGSITSFALINVASTDECKEEENPVYSCDMLKLTTVSGRNIKAEVTTTALNGASLSTISYDFGDGSTKLVTDKSSVNYTYAKDGTFTVKAVPSFKIGDKTFTATSDNCVKQVTFSAIPTPTPTPTPPKELPNTGAGSILGLFAGTSIVGAIGHRLWMIRRLSR